MTTPNELVSEYSVATSSLALKNNKLEMKKIERLRTLQHCHILHHYKTKWNLQNLQIWETVENAF